MHSFGCRPHELWPVCQPIGLPLFLTWRFDFETQMWRGEAEVRLVVMICATRSCRNKTRLEGHLDQQL